MQVVCNQCHAVCEVDADRFATPSAELTCSACGAALALPAVEVGAESSWLVLMPHGQVGPYTAPQMAELLDHASIDWSAMIWRPGLKGWRPARRDPLLITSVSSARGTGAFGDTQRITPGRRSLLPAADTIVEPLPRALARRVAEGEPLAARTSAPDSGEEFTQVTQRVPPPAAPAGIFSDALRSAPGVVATAQREPRAPGDPQPVAARASSPISWLPSVQSMALVAIVAFAMGVLAAALWGRFLARREQSAATMVVHAAPAAATSAEPPPASSRPAAGAPEARAAVDVQSLAAPILIDLPAEAELRRELRRVSPDVRRCIADPGLGAEVEARFEGRDGRVGELRVRTPGLSPGVVECVTQALRQMQVTPFRRPSYRLWHRFSY